MAEIIVAAAADQDDKARGLAEALAALGFEAAFDTPADDEIAAIVDQARCVLTLWDARAEAPPPWLAVLSTLALERDKLVSAELNAGATPAPFQNAPRIALDTPDRGEFKARFEALVYEIEKRTPTEGDSDALPNALILARAALAPHAASHAPPPTPDVALPPTRPPARPKARQTQTRLRIGAPGVILFSTAALFAFGFGVGRIIYAARQGVFSPAPRTASAAAAPAAPAAPAYGVTLADLAALPWRDAADKLAPDAAPAIKAAANAGDPLAQTLACLGHLAGAEGFLPSPTAARANCDAAAAQGFPAALYLSWSLRRAAPHAGLSEAVAHERLAAAAERGWAPALVDYALALAPDARAPLPAQTQAGRLLLAAAERDYPRAQYFYARWLRDSPAGPRDPAAAAPFLERAASKGQPEAMHMLATFYRDGVGVTRDPARARALYEQAAAAAYPAAMFNLADLLRSGGPEDRARAVTLYQALSCMRDELQIQPRALQRLRALGAAPGACA